MYADRFLHQKCRSVLGVVVSRQVWVLEVLGSIPGARLLLAKEVRVFWNGFEEGRSGRREPTLGGSLVLS